MFEYRGRIALVTGASGGSAPPSSMRWQDGA